MKGAHVFITGRRQKELDEAVKAIGTNVSGVHGDVAQLADLDRLYETVAKVKGRTCIVFANGTCRLSPSSWYKVNADAGIYQGRTERLDIS